MMLFAEAALSQELQLQNSPYSAYLDLRATSKEAPAQTVPAWIEGFEFLASDAAAKAVVAAPASQVAAHGTLTDPANSRPRATSVFRIRVQRPAKVSDDLQMRMFFEDRSLSERPSVTAWDELGTELMRSSPLGQGLGLPTSETLTIPMTGVNYLEIETPGDGGLIRGVFFTWLEKAQIRQPIDFPTVGKVTEPFGVISATRTHAEDAYLYGVVTASLQQTPMTLTAGDATATIQFELERQPMVAIVSYEVLGVTLGEPPLMHINGRSLGTLDLILPDLADPGYQGHSRSGEDSLGFHYTGWVRAQKVVPRQLLLAGLNELKIGLSNGSNPVAIRSIEIQLKYNWEKLDYVLAPAPTPFPR